MAQWIPKTAWKVSNLNKRYGPSYITSGYNNDNTFSSVLPLHDVRKLREKLFSRKSLVIIDVRDSVERKLYPVSSSVPLHIHDLLSGAACPILPRNKEKSELFILTSGDQRGINASSALRRWGYDNVSIINYNTLVEADCIPKKSRQKNLTFF